jgi:hypothetical protein
VLLDDVDDHVPLPSVDDGSFEEEVHQAAVNRLARLPIVQVSHVVQEVVAPLNL